MKKAWPNDTWPANPVRMFNPRPPMAKISTVVRSRSQSPSARKLGPGSDPIGLSPPPIDPALNNGMATMNMKNRNRATRLVVVLTMAWSAS